MAIASLCCGRTPCGALKECFKDDFFIKQFHHALHLYSSHNVKVTFREIGGWGWAG